LLDAFLAALYSRHFRTERREFTRWSNRSSNEKFDSEVFIKAFGRIERNPALILPDRPLSVIIPVHAIPRGYN
jgi:hypothetical protein